MSNKFDLSNIATQLNTPPNRKESSYLEVTWIPPRLVTVAGGNANLIAFLMIKTIRVYFFTTGRVS